MILAHTTDYLDECLSSVAGQTVAPSAVVLVDNGSGSDAVHEIARRFGIPTIRLDWPVTPSAARNVGCSALVDCDLVVSLDGDDLLKPRFVEVYWSAARDRQADVVFGAAELIGAQTGVAFTRRQLGSAPDLRRRNHVPANSLFKRRLWREVGGFDPAVVYFEDWDFWLSLSEQGAVFEHIDEPLWCYRRHQQSRMAVGDPAEQTRSKDVIRRKHGRHMFGLLQWRRALWKLESMRDGAGPGRGAGPRRVFLDVGGHTGESVSAALDRRWGFDRVWTFEPTKRCVEILEGIPDDRLTVVPAGWWSADTEMVIHDPGTLHASVDAAASRAGEVEHCRFVDAARWMAENIDADDQVWLKINIEGAEVDVLDRLLTSGEIAKVRHLVVHFDIEKLGQPDKAVAMRARLDGAGVPWREASAVMFGRTDTAKVHTWLAWTEGRRLSFTRQKVEHLLRRQVFLLRRRLGQRRPDRARASR